MKNTSLVMDGKSTGRLLSGHNAKGKEADHWLSDIMTPAVGLISNMDDMMKFLSANTGISNTEIKNILDYTHNPRIRFNSKKYGTMEAALGWLVSPLEKGNMKYVWQEGITEGFSSFIGFVETSKTGVVILSNSAVPVAELEKKILEKVN
jgi:beta-lactamase class C